MKSEVVGLNQISTMLPRNGRKNIMMEDGVVHEHLGIPAEADSVLGNENQITMPQSIVDVLRAHPGDRFNWIVEDGALGVVRLHRLLDSYAASLSGVYGDNDQIAEYLAVERESWGE